MMTIGRRRLVVGALAGAAVAAPALRGSHAQTARERIVRDGRTSIGIHNRRPWGFRGPDGNATGFHPDLVRAALAPLGVTTIDFVIADFGALIPGLLASRFDMVASGLGITPERCQVVAFSDPDLSIGDAILVQQGNPLRIHSYRDIAANARARLGASRGSANARNAQLAGIPDAQISLFQNTESTLAALMANRVDAITFSSPTVIGLLEDPNVRGVERALPFEGYVKPNGRENMLYSAIAFRRADGALRDLYNARLADMKRDGTVATLMGRYGFSAAERAPDLDQDQICRGDD
jgi:polar amino acid transport system substrate-binding protein